MSRYGLPHHHTHSHKTSYENLNVVEKDLETDCLPD